MEYSIAFAQRRDELALKRLFLNCFDDTLGFVNMFFSKHFVPENTVAVYCGEDIVGEAHMLPCSVGERDCLYIYGVCISPLHRMKKLGSRMLEFMKAEAERRGCALLLHPQSDGVVAFYEKSGFSVCGRWSEITVHPTAAAADLRPASAAEYKAVRDSMFADFRPLVWDEASVKYALMQETFFGFSAYKCTLSGREHIVLCGMDEGRLYIKETTVPVGELDAVAAALAEKYGTDNINVRLPFDPRVGESSVCGLGFGIDGDIYMNLLLE